MKQYNFYNLEASFIEFLNSGKRNLSKITIKNYISDLRHFFGWFIFRLKASQEYSKFVDSLEIPTLITRCLSQLIVVQYKAYLISNSIPFQTSNRRLSTLRKLAEFFVSQRWLNENPTSNLRNITNNSKSTQNKYYIPEDSTKLVLLEYKKALQSQNLKSETIDSYMADIKDFIKFI